MITKECIHYVTRPAKINHVSAKICRFSNLLCSDLIASTYANATQCLPLKQNLMGFLLQRDIAFRTEDLSQNAHVIDFASLVTYCFYLKILLP